MGLFSLTQELAIDLGTANTLIIHNGKVVVDEPSIVALDVHTGKLVAIGTQARQMHEKTNPNIKTIRPLKDGVIADFNATELMLRGMIKKVKTSGNLFAPSIRMVICIPSGSTNVEIRAVRDSAEHAGGREVYMIYEPMAAALECVKEFAEPACVIVKHANPCGVAIGNSILPEQSHTLEQYVPISLLLFLKLDYQ